MGRRVSGPRLHHGSGQRAHADRHGFRGDGNHRSSHIGLAPRHRLDRAAAHSLVDNKRIFTFKTMNGKTMIRGTILSILMSVAITGNALAQDKLTVLLEWFVNPDHAPLIVAQQLGFFEKAGLEVEFIPPTDPSIVPRAVASGQAEIGIHYQPN